MKMIHEACKQLVERGFNEVEQLNDNYGTIGYALTFMETNYILVAKEYAYDDLASFIARLVVGMPDNVDYIFYNRDDDSYTVFDGQYLREHSEISSGPSKKRDCKWREIPLSSGAELDAYISGKESPDTLSGDNEQLSAFA